MNTQKTYVYIDSFNLYYGALNHSKKGIKWLNVESWLHKVFKPTLYDIQKIKYFTANVSGTKKDPLKPNRQQAYFRALATLPKLERVMGNFIKKKTKISVTDDVSIVARVFEEKGTDVNIATHIVNDAHNKKYDTAIVVCNDSDIADAVRIVTGELNLKVIVVNPSSGYPSNVLSKYASFTKNIREGQILSSQFPAQLNDATGVIHKPLNW
jgi:uncharacterized LabA/DUF88 family protein